MKNKILLIAIMFAAFCNTGANAQVSVQFNIGTQPLWGPTGYDYAEYYYLPDIDAYYDVARQDYVYYDRGRWITTAVLPPLYPNYDIYSAHKVVINEPTPWLRNDYYRIQYAHYKGHHDQSIIRDSRDHRYWANPGHPYHSHWKGQDYGRGNNYERSKQWNGYRRNNGNDRHDNGHGKHDNGRGNGRGHGKH